MAPKKKGMYKCSHDLYSTEFCTVLYKVLVLQRPVSTLPVCGSENVEDHTFT